jgi:hypothetical protein
MVNWHEIDSDAISNNFLTTKRTFENTFCIDFNKKTLSCRGEPCVHPSEVNRTPIQAQFINHPMNSDSLE